LATSYIGSDETGKILDPSNHLAENMKAVLWLWYVSLARATCTSNYAIWISQDRANLSETLGQALPKLDYDDISNLNPGVDVGMAAVPGKRYKIPYTANMALIPPASWSDNHAVPTCRSYPPTGQRKKNSPYKMSNFTCTVLGRN